MNELEKKSFYSFLGLYIFSSFLFLALIGYWYYEAQKSALENETYYKLQHISDVKSGDIIMSHMAKKKLKTREVPKDVELALINTQGEVVSGRLHMKKVPKKAGYFKEGGYSIFVSDSPREHLNIKYVVAQSNALDYSLSKLQQLVIAVMLIVAFLLVVIAWVLSKLFMRPIRQKVEQIERFINDVTHELNTPITALSMSTNLALKKGECTEKTLNNISISTKQLYDIYSSLAYLNFSQKKEHDEPVDISEVLKRSIDYYTPLCQSKHIKFEIDIEPYIVVMPQAQLKLLYGNLIGNAIKYSPAKTTIKLSIKDGVFTIKDEGIGIEEEKQKEIFEKYKRGTGYSGGFGVGLSIVKSICDEYGIVIELDSNLGKGTEVRLYFS
jgi:two-component system OmpR family sensor kinase